MTDPVPCLDCHRPLKTPESVARKRGRHCQEIFEGDTHIAPKPRRPMRRKRLPEDEPFPNFPIERTTTVDDVDRIYEAAHEAAPDVNSAIVWSIVNAAMLKLDELITEDREHDGTWPDAGDLVELFTA